MGNPNREHFVLDVSEPLPVMRIPNPAYREVVAFGLDKPQAETRWLPVDEYERGVRPMENGLPCYHWRGQVRA